MKTDDERLAELEAAETSLLASLHALQPNGKHIYSAEERTKLANAAGKMHSEMTAIEHLKLQRRKLEPDDEALDRLAPKELERRIDEAQANLAKLRAKLPHLQVVK